jgi:hypothetical protein
MLITFGALFVSAYQRPSAGPPRIVLGGDTDPLLAKAEAAAPDEITDPGEEQPRKSRWTLMSALMVAALAASLIVSLTLWLKLQRVRDDLADAEAAAEKSVASKIAELPVPPEAAAAAEAAPTSAAPTAIAAAIAGATPRAGAPEHLLLLVTVGTRHFAEKQLRDLKPKCRAPLAVYQQKRGRCAWSTCFAVAAAESDADLARNCGSTQGQSLREKKDFIPVASNR